MIDWKHTASGPKYPRQLGATVARYRFMARKGLKDLSSRERRLYGEAVEKAILALQRTEFMRSAVEPVLRPHCASGSWETTGEGIERAVREQHKRALLACPGVERRQRSDYDWQAGYAAAMKEKRARQNAKVAA